MNPYIPPSRKTRNERTSLRIGRIAARVLASKSNFESDVTWVEVKALAASCLTQLPDKVKRKLFPTQSTPRIKIPVKRKPRDSQTLASAIWKQERRNK